ncbi:UDP-N-acetyl-alpha-D-glucosamine C6 dehydratase [Vibrio sp. THAF191c]|nr:polysaccharide biosynthesis protein [Vibrio sp. SCSIO 43169]QFT36749.1 UDP-N-acetyl-alpha-D-glucosamine C6 dehydratase [Vibrio sp. THAF64]QGM34650.1 UDP-N-acetyl-alpha-D-glucosamine C6 dehydratase [Vibrio sp. THAF191d]QGN70152.1 UDP-N-acetyl-alpha-D-glucosamine C6 dehydratase [Vibrio sp. THAF191c]
MTSVCDISSREPLQPAAMSAEGVAKLDLRTGGQQEPIIVKHLPPMNDPSLNIAALLGREAITSNQQLLAKNITGKNVMVTGAGGSIGSELCRQVLKQNPKSLILFELNEYNLYQIDQELSASSITNASTVKIVPILGSVQTEQRLITLMKNHNVDTIYHTAAYKHVPLVEDNIIAGIQNNVFGTLSCAQAAIEAKVENFTLISTDKAVRPTNIMGASKRLAELVLQALADKKTATTFTIVRFGNVLGSSGSVVPLFKKQIEAGGPITITHPEIVRYFMLTQEAAELVIQASAMGHNGQVFVLDMGEPVKIVELARKMIQLSGKKEGLLGNTHHDEIAIQFIGLRPGEKLYEELLIGGNVEETCHHKIMTAMEEKLNWQEMALVLSELERNCNEHDVVAIKQTLLSAPTGYQTANVHKETSDVC